MYYMKRSPQQNIYTVAMEAYYGNLPGSLEDLSDKIRVALREKFIGSDGETYLSVLGTYASRVIYSIGGNSKKKEIYYAVSYTLDEGGNVVISEDSKEVKIATVVTVPTGIGTEQGKEIQAAINTALEKFIPFKKGTKKDPEEGDDMDGDDTGKKKKKAVKPWVKK